MGWLADLVNLSRPRPVPPKPQPLPKLPADVTGALLAAHNVVRDRHGLAPLTLDGRLVLAAACHAQTMADHRMLSHSGYGDGSPWDRLISFGYHYSAASENIAEGQNDIAEVMATWLNSPSHRANILGPYHDFGGALATTVPEGTLYWCTVFGRLT